MDWVFAILQSDSDPTCEKPMTNSSLSVGSVLCAVHPTMLTAIAAQMIKLQNRLIFKFFLSRETYGDSCSLPGFTYYVEVDVISVKELKSFIC